MAGTGLSKQKIKILIADDNKDVNVLLSATLELKGYEAYKTYSADECLSKLNDGISNPYYQQSDSITC